MSVGVGDGRGRGGDGWLDDGYCGWGYIFGDDASWMLEIYMILGGNQVHTTTGTSFFFHLLIKMQLALYKTERNN